MLALIILGCLAVVQCAPTEQAAAVAAAKEVPQQEINAKHLPQLREYLILTPETQLQLQPNLKLQQSMIQPLALYGSTGSKRQYDAICSQIQSGVGSLSDIFLGNFPFLEIGDQGDGSDSRDAITTKQQQAETNVDSEAAPQGIVAKIPAAVYPVAAEHRFYTIAGRPQFFSSVDALQNPLQPIFSIQPLQAIKARSIADPISAIIQEGNSPNLISQNSDGLPLALPLQSDANIPLEKIQAGENAALNFARSLEEKNQEQVVAINSVATQFANRFDNELAKESMKPDSEIPISENVDLKQGEASAKSVDFLETRELAISEGANEAEIQANVQNLDLAQQQVKLAQDESGNETTEK